MTEPMSHCWESGPWVGDYEDGHGSTCMLPDGHDGPHEFVPDNEIIIRFTGSTRDSREPNKQRETNK